MKKFLYSYRIGYHFKNIQKTVWRLLHQTEAMKILRRIKCDVFPYLLQYKGSTSVGFGGGHSVSFKSEHHGSSHLLGLDKIHCGLQLRSLY